MTIENYLIWMVYAGALEGEKLRKNADIVRRPSWKQDIVRVRAVLASKGVTL